MASEPESQPYRPFDPDMIKLLEQMADAAQDMAFSNLDDLMKWANSDDGGGTIGERKIVAVIGNVGGMIAHLQNQNATMTHLLLEIALNTRPSDPDS